MTLNILNLHGYVSFFDLANSDPATRESGNRWHSKLWPNFVIFDKGNINPQNPDPAHQLSSKFQFFSPAPKSPNHKRLICVKKTALEYLMLGPL